MLRVSAALFFLATPAFADDDVKTISYDLSWVITDNQGHPVPTCDKPENTTDPVTGEPHFKCFASRSLTVNDVVVMALAKPPGPTDSTTLIDQVKRGALAQRLVGKARAELTHAEVTMIEDQLGNLRQSPMVIYQVMKAIDPNQLKKM